MANQNRGEYDLTIEGTTYTLVLYATDVDELESKLGAGRKLLAEIARSEATEAVQRQIVTRAFRRVHPPLTTEQIKRLYNIAPRNKVHQAAFYLMAGALNILNEQQEDDEPLPAADGKEVGVEGNGVTSPFSAETDD